MSDILFSDLDLIEPLQRALASANYTSPTPIQAEAIPCLLEGGDLLACAQTGTGKTAAFSLPMLQLLHTSKKGRRKKCARSLILTPTRELALQIAENVAKYGKHLDIKSAAIYGGVGQFPQVKAISKGLDVLIATPGRLLDLISQGHVRLDEIEILVLDEADRMLDMGFIRDVKKILRDMPSDRQTLLFSATMPKEVAHLADSVLNNPKKINVNPVSSTADLIEDHVLFVDTSNKRALLIEVLMRKDVTRALVFTRTKHRANRLARDLGNKKIRAEAIHGNKSQNARQKALKEFSTGKVKVMVATDIVARGIDVTGITHVINYELPNEPESYVHRIGRTARAGTAGIALSFCDREEAEYLASIEKMLKRKVNVDKDHAFHSPEIESDHVNGRIKKAPAKKRGGGRRNGSSQRRRPRSAGAGGGRSGGGSSRRRGSSSSGSKPKLRANAG